MYLLLESQSLKWVSQRSHKTLGAPKSSFPPATYRKTAHLASPQSVFRAETYSWPGARKELSESSHFCVTPSGLSHLEGWYDHNASLCIIEYQHNGCTVGLLSVVENQTRYLIALDSSSALNPWACGHHLSHESSPLVASEKSQSFPPSPVLPSLSASSTSPH